MKLKCLAALLFVFVLCNPAFAYEDDVHYGLTKWLALVAGMSAADAEVVARGTKEVDGGALDAVTLTFFYACVGNDNVGSELVQTHHFPSQGPIPGKASERAVTADSGPARTMAEDRIKNPQVNTRGAAWNLRHFGFGLHAYQDSFSHQGEPEIPGFTFVRCNRELGWGHPQKRGGWNHHDADLTSWDQRTAAAMAAGTYQLICDYRKQVEGARCNKEWKDIAADVDRFIAADTKAKKWQWFSTGNPFSAQFSCEFLREINLDNGSWSWCPNFKYPDADFSAKLATQRNPPPEAAERAAVPAAFVRAALETWFVKRDVFSLTAFYVDQGSFKTAYGLADFNRVEDVQGASVAHFSAWLARDHGSVRNRLTARGPQLVDASRRIKADVQWRGLNEPLPNASVENPAGTALVNYQSLEEALAPISPGMQLFALHGAACLDGKGECAVAAARLKKAPYETLLLELRRVDGRWRIAKAWPYVDH